MTASKDRLGQDMTVLGAVGQRFAGSEGERAMLHAVKERLPGDIEVRIDPFVAHTAPEIALGLHAAFLLLSGVVGFRWPALGGIASGIITLSLIAEALGSMSLFRFLLPKSPSYNLVGRSGSGECFGALILCAPLDVPRWRPRAFLWIKRPLQLVLGAAVITTLMLALRTMAEPWAAPTLGMYLVCLVILAGAMAALVFAHRRERGDGRGDASGPAVLIELMRRWQLRPVPGLEIWTVFTGCGHAHQGGMRAFLTLRKPTLPDPALVVALEEPGRPTLYSAVSEGALWPVHHRSTGPALVERLRWAGLELPRLLYAGSTDARAAYLLGYRGLGLVGLGGEPSAEAAADAADTIETMVRWFGEDLVRIHSQQHPGTTLP